MRKKLFLGASAILMGIAIMILGSFLSNNVQNMDIFTAKAKLMIFGVIMLMTLGIVLIAIGFGIIGTILD